MKCRVCNRDESLNASRFGVCWDCATFESLIMDGSDMDDKPQPRDIDGSLALNILHAILVTYGVKT